MLIVDAEPQLHRVLTLNLATRGYDVASAQNGTDALLEASRHPPDVVVLDLDLPDIHGFQVIRMLRTRATTRIIVLSSCTSSEDKIRALDLGADDYLQKPFDMQKFLARLHAATRAVQSGLAAGTVLLGPSTVDFAARTVERNDGVGSFMVDLTALEWQLLEIMLRRPGALVTERQLLGALRGSPHHIDGSQLRMYVAQLRRKLGDGPSRPRYLLTEPGMGYRIAL